MKRNAMAMSMLLLAALLFNTACGTGTTAAKNESGSQSAAENSGLDSAHPIKVAVAAPMTGDNSEYGIGFANAAKLMAKQWNEKGGCLGREVQIVEYDDKNSSEEATTIAQKIVLEKDEIAGVIGRMYDGGADL